MQFSGPKKVGLTALPSLLLIGEEFLGFQKLYHLSFLFFFFFFHTVFVECLLCTLLNSKGCCLCKDRVLISFKRGGLW